MATELEILTVKLNIARAAEERAKNALNEAQEALYAAQDTIRDLERQHYLLTRTARQKREDERDEAERLERAAEEKRRILYRDVKPGMTLMYDGLDQVVTIKRVNRIPKTARYNPGGINSFTIVLEDGTTDKVESGNFYTPLETEAPRNLICPVMCARCDRVVEYGELDERDLCYACQMDLAEED